eukprot:gb/GEZJ01003181.1/.p1 GENE.gb/GEZJ01003181.1/~~gb/GEZJ01003181.1/.p1  ORF type:complete len:348 (+),score=43.84 gb/GEZJ01003181.1/:1760-2803(+)
MSLSLSTPSVHSHSQLTTMSNTRAPSSPQTPPPAFDEDDDDASLPEQNDFDPTDDESHHSYFPNAESSSRPSQSRPQRSSDAPTEVTAQPENQSVTSGHASPTQQRRNHHNTHTRRCRARLNNRFDTLNNMLPRSPTVEVKHKVHILDHAVSALQHMHQENANLELFLAMRSKHKLVAWVDSYVISATTVQAALSPLIDLISQTGSWPYAEVWRTDPPNMSLVHTKLRGSSMQYPALSTLARFSAAQHQFPIASDFTGRSFETRAPFWTSSPTQLCQVVNRAQLMAAARLRCAFSVPVPVAGEIPFVLSFYDVRQRDRDAAQLHSAAFAAVCVGNAWAAKQADAVAS